jgi:hypothetical protein
MMRTTARHGMEGGARRGKEASNARILVPGADPIAAALGIADEQEADNRRGLLRHHVTRQDLTKAFPKGVTAICISSNEICGRYVTFRTFKRRRGGQHAYYRRCSHTCLLLTVFGEQHAIAKPRPGRSLDCAATLEPARRLHGIVIHVRRGSPLVRWRSSFRRRRKPCAVERAAAIGRRRRSGRCCAASPERS